THIATFIKNAGVGYLMWDGKHHRTSDACANEMHHRTPDECANKMYAKVLGKPPKSRLNGWSCMKLTEDGKVSLSSMRKRFLQLTAEGKVSLSSLRKRFLQHNEQRAVEGMQRPEEHFNPYLKLLNEQEELRHREQLQAVEKQKEGLCHREQLQAVEKQKFLSDKAALFRLAIDRLRIMAANPPPLWIAPEEDASKLEEEDRFL
ncbi:hypothetical protein T484DRAFT_1801166, partial [Baffinella frigidus]